MRVCRHKLEPAQGISRTQNTEPSIPECELQARGEAQGFIVDGCEQRYGLKLRSTIIQRDIERRQGAEITHDVGRIFEIGRQKARRIVTIERRRFVRYLPLAAHGFYVSVSKIIHGDGDLLRMWRSRLIGELPFPRGIEIEIDRAAEACENLEDVCSTRTQGALRDKQRWRIGWDHIGSSFVRSKERAAENEACIANAGRGFGGCNASDAAGGYDLLRLGLRRYLCIRLLGKCQATHSDDAYQGEGTSLR
jgi:hypothetical protein